MTVEVCFFSAGTTKAAGLDIFTDLRVVDGADVDFTNLMSELVLDLRK